MKSPKYKILVVGLGNPLRGDDRLGLKVVKKLNREEWSSKIGLLKMGSSPINYLQEIRQAQTVIAVDAIEGRKPPGSIYQLTLNEIAKQSKRGGNAHTYSLPEVISLAREITNFPEQVLLYGIEPKDLTFNDQLSPPVKKNLPKLMEKIKTKLKHLSQET